MNIEQQLPVEAAGAPMLKNCEVITSQVVKTHPMFC